jgi:hypothetical protein
MSALRFFLKNINKSVNKPDDDDGPDEVAHRVPKVMNVRVLANLSL